MNRLIIKYSQLFSFIYFKSSILKLISPVAIRDEIIVNPSEKFSCPTCNTKLADGTSYYPIYKNAASPGEIDAAAIDGVRQFKHDYGNFSKIDLKRAVLFEQFVKYLKSQKIEVIFYLPPLEPLAYTILREHKQYQNIFASERFYLVIARKYQFRVVGSYDPYSLKLNTEDFIDELHLKKRGLDKVFDQYLL